jgi:hypothetical protein
MSLLESVWHLICTQNKNPNYPLSMRIYAMKLQSFNNSATKTVGFAVASLALSLVATAPAHAVAAIFYNSPTAGATQFDNTVTGAGGTVTADTWTSLASGVTSIDRGDYTLSRINGGSLFPSNYGTLTGQILDIFPSDRDVELSRPSGIQFSFDAPVNSIGFEVGDWGTCCLPSALYISFDGGAPIEVGTALTGSDVVFDGKYEVFVGAIDDTSSSFSTVQFWGNGTGEALYAGGTIRYANVAVGSVSDPTAVPEPFTIVGTLIGGTAAMRMRKKLKSNDKV